MKYSVDKGMVSDSNIFQASEQQNNVRFTDSNGKYVPRSLISNTEIQYRIEFLHDFCAQIWTAEGLENDISRQYQHFKSSNSSCRFQQ